METYSAPPVRNGTLSGETLTGVSVCSTAPAAKITHRPSVAISRVQVINQDCVAQDVFKNCKGSKRQEVLVMVYPNIHKLYYFSTVYTKKIQNKKIEVNEG